MNEPKRPSASLAMLLGAAAALSSGSCRADSAAPSEDGAEDASGATRTSYRYSEYDEDALDSVPLDGSAARYRIRAHQFRVDTRLGERHALNLSGTQEIMSGSSPWFVMPDADNRPAQVMSGATIKDTRRELVASLVRNPDAGNKTTISVSYSDEDDYRAAALGVERSQEISPQLTLGFGASFSDDTLHPTDAVLFARVEREEKNTASGFASLAWVLNKSAVLQSGLQINSHHGYLSDPYKLALVGNRTLPDTRPDERLQAAWLLRYRHAFLEADGALHADYRYAWDDWSVRSHTVEVSWYQSLGQGWRLIPSARYYSQSEAEFFGNFFTTAQGAEFFSSDYRLGNYGAVSAKLSLRKRYGAFELSVGAERYRSSEDYAVGGAEDAVPALVSFTRLFVGFDYAFE